jgi:hypothetical protein
MYLAIINETAAYCGGEGIWYNLWEKEIAWLIVIGYATFIALMFFKRSAQAKKVSSGYQSEIFKAFGLFILGIVGARIFFIFSDIERWNNCQSTLHAQYVLFSYTVGIFSSLMLLKVIERDVLLMKKGIGFKMYLTFALIALMLAIFASIIIEYLDTIRLINTIISSFGAGLLMILYIKMIMLSTGEVRRQALLTLLGVVTIFLGSIIDSELLIRQLNIPIWLPAIFPMVGFSLILYIQLQIGKSLDIS